MILAWQNNWDSASLAASSALGTLPVTNTQVVHLSQKWQTVAAVKTAFVTADMGTDETKWKQSLLAVLGSNLTKNAAMRLRASPTDANATTDVVYDSGVICAARVRAMTMVRVATGALNYASTPSSPANRLTGAMDVRVRARIDRGVPNEEMYFANKGGGAFFLSWIFGFTQAGQLFLYLSTDGATWANAGNSYPSTASFANILDGVPRWYRFTRSAAGQIIFYTSEDGATWTQLGAAVAGTATALFDTTGDLRLRGWDSGSLSGAMIYAELRNAIGGQVVASFDPETDAVVGSTSFQSSASREVWTINQSGSPKSEIVNVDNANLKTGFGALYKPLALSYLKLSGIAGNYASTPDTAANSVTGDLDLRIKMSLNDWTPAAAQVPFNKFDGVSAQRAYMLYVDTGGFVRLYWSTNGVVELNAVSTVAVPAADGATIWLRATLDVDNGAAGRDIKFYTSADGVVWTQLGATVTQGGTTSIFNATSALLVGGWNVGSNDPMIGVVYYAEVRNGLDGPIVASFDPSRAAASGATSLTAETGEVWTINQSGSPKAELVRDSFVRARYWRLDLTDYSVASSLQAGRVFLGPSWSISQAMLYGWSAMEVDPSNVTKSRGGQAFPDAVAKYRMLDFTLDFVSEASIFDNAFAMARANGTVKDVLAIPLETGSYISEQSVWGRIISQEPLIHRLSQIFRQKFTVEERL